MKVLATLLLAIFSALLPSSRAAEEATSGSGPILVVPVREEISPTQFFLMRLAIKDAERRHASAIILDMDTWGGDIHSAESNIAALLKTRIPKYTFVNGKAISAGSLIALATNHIYMTPTGVIGAAAPVSSTGEDLSKTMTAKVISALSAIGRGAAIANGHNPELADAFIRKEAVFKFGEITYDGPETLLTLTGTQATTRVDGKPLLAEDTVTSIKELVEKAKLTGPVVDFEPRGFEWLAVWVTTLAPLLLWGGVVGAYLEIKTPGFGIFGITSAICFTLFFAGHYLAGLAGWEVIVLFLIGFGLVLSEVFVHPGTIVPGLAGVVFMFLALIYAMVDRYPSDPWWPSDAMLTRPLINLGLAFLGACIAILILGKMLPKSRMFKWIVLSTTTPHGAGPMLPEAAPNVLTGAAGTARTTLRPAGKADFGGRVLDVVSQGDFIEAGQAVRVVAVEGVRVVVEAAG